MTLVAKKPRRLSGPKAAEDPMRGVKARTVTERLPNLLPASLPHAETESQFVELLGEVSALALSMAEQRDELIRLKGPLPVNPRSRQEYRPQAQRQPFSEYQNQSGCLTAAMPPSFCSSFKVRRSAPSREKSKFVELLGEAWELRRIVMVQRNAIACMKNGPVDSDMGKDRSEAFRDKVLMRLTPSNEATDELVLVVHSLAQLWWREKNGNIPASLESSIAWFLLPGQERRQWIGRAAVATMEWQRSVRNGLREEPV